MDCNSTKHEIARVACRTWRLMVHPFQGLCPTRTMSMGVDGCMQMHRLPGLVVLGVISTAFTAIRDITGGSGELHRRLAFRRFIASSVQRVKTAFAVIILVKFIRGPGPKGPRDNNLINCCFGHQPEASARASNFPR
jgi:hypothetical protein